MRKFVLIMIIVLGFCHAGLAQVGDTIPKGFKGDDIVAVVKSLENVVYAKGRLQYIGPKEVLDKVYVFKLSDDAVLSSPDGVWLEGTTKGIKPYESSRPAGPYYLIKDMGKQTRNWTGQNIFGARTRAETTTFTKYLIIPNRDIGKIPVKPGDAKVGVLIVGKPIIIEDSAGKGYVTDIGAYSPATWDMPVSWIRKFKVIKMEIQEVVVYDQDSGRVLLRKSNQAVLSMKALEYGNRIDELHKRMANELDILAKSDPHNALAVSTVIIPNVKKLITERNNLKNEALKYYHGKLPPDLAKKFEESENKTDLVREIMQRARVQW